MIEFVKGDIFENPSNVLVNAVNCMGAAGRGLALQFRQKFPKMFRDYQTVCRNGALRVGYIHIWQNPNPQPEWIINFPTKDHWKNPSKIEYITDGLEALVTWVKQQKITSISIPPLGCGLGKLPWPSVRAEILKAFAEFENEQSVKIVIYQP